MRRNLVEVKTGDVIGAVDDQAAEPFQGAAAEVLTGLRARLGDKGAVRDVLAHGWSNGYLYFAEPIQLPTAAASEEPGEQDEP